MSQGPGKNQHAAGLVAIRLGANLCPVVDEEVDAMGGQVLSTVQEDGANAIARPGQIIHEVGGVIMGDDPSRSVLNEFCQSWEVDTLFVTDGGCFVSNADKNPTLSIMAIAWRASDYIAEQLGQRSIG